MPEGLEKGLSVQEFADLIAFVRTIRATPPPAKYGVHSSRKPLRLIPPPTGCDSIAWRRQPQYTKHATLRPKPRTPLALNGRTWRPAAFRAPIADSLARDLGTLGGSGQDLRAEGQVVARRCG